MIGCTASSDNEQTRPHSNVEYLADVREIPVKPLPECLDTFLHIHCHCAYTTALKAKTLFRSKPQETPKQRFAQRGSKSDALQYKLARLSPQQHISGERVGSNPSDFTSITSSMRRVTMIPVSQALDGRRTGVLRPTFTMVLRHWNE